MDIRNIISEAFGVNMSYGDETFHNPKVPEEGQRLEHKDGRKGTLVSSDPNGHRVKWDAHDEHESYTSRIGTNDIKSHANSPANDL